MTDENTRNQDIRPKQGQTQVDQKEAGARAGAPGVGGSGKAPSGGGKKTKKNGPLWAVVAVVVIVAIILIALWRMGVFSSMGNIGDAVGGGEAVATVNGAEITRQQFQEEFQPLEERIANLNAGTSTNKEQIRQQAKTRVINQLVNRELLSMKAQSAGIEVTDQQVQSQFQSAKSRINQQNQSGATGTSGQSFSERLQQAGFESEQEYRDQIRTQLLISQYVEQNVDTQNATVTDQQARERYDQLTQGSNAQTAQVPPFDQVSSQIKQQIQQQNQQQQIQQFIQNLRDQADVEILIETAGASASAQGASSPASGAVPSTPTPSQ